MNHADPMDANCSSVFIGEALSGAMVAECCRPVVGVVMELVLIVILFSGFLFCSTLSHFSISWNFMMTHHI